MFTKIDTQDINLAMDAAGHDFEVEKVQIKTINNDTVIPDHVAVMKKDTTHYLGTVGKGWEPVQPATIYELAQELMDATGGSINEVFSMKGDSVIGISFKLAEREYVAGDKLSLNFLMITSFDSSYGIAGHATCHSINRNTQVNTSNKVYNLKHTRFVGNRLEVVKGMLKFYNSEIQLFDKKMGKLVTKAMSKQDAIKWFRGLFPEPKSPRGERMLENQVELFLQSYENCQQGVRGTRYGAFQALTDYINNHRSVRVHQGRDEDEVRFQSIHFGTANVLAQKAMNTLTKDFEKKEKVDGNFTEFSEDEFTV
jgi:phage/plasmid-like protein (TIGR03299 family)